MHFGRVEHIEQCKLDLPQDRLRTKRFLALPHHNTRRELHLGAPIWACKEWESSFYPQGLSPSRYLEYYSQIFSCVELNSSFYGLPPIRQIRYWQSQVTGDFRFCPKLSKSASHQPLSPTLDADIAAFCRHVEAFADKLGLCFIQFPETLGWSERHILANFIKRLPKNLRWAIELRHPSWFSDHMLRDAVIDLFYRYQISAVITDTPGRRDVLHLSLTQPQVMIRFQGHFPSLTDNKRLKDWKPRLKKWQSHGLDQIYFFIHQARVVTIPETCLYMKRLLEYEN